MAFVVRLVAFLLAVGLWVLGVLRWVDGAHVVGAALILAGGCLGIGAIVSRKRRGDSIAETVGEFLRSIPS